MKHYLENSKLCPIGKKKWKLICFGANMYKHGLLAFAKMHFSYLIEEVVCAVSSKLYC